MARVIVTGDIHGATGRIVQLADDLQLSAADIIILLGDVACNYFGDTRDNVVKQQLNDIGVTILAVHGNHERRPGTIDTYHEVMWHGGIVYVEDAYPNLLFAKDGQIFDLNGKKCMAIGGAYSIDKEVRLLRGWKWFYDEQPSDKIKEYVESQLETHRGVDIILSHTCPLQYVPVDCFLSGIDQSTVDTSTEAWLQYIEQTYRYDRWFCGHFHINRSVEKLTLLFDDWEEI